MTNPTPLSPAAQAVLDAYIAGLASKRRNAIAAALRAAADQVIEEICPVEEIIAIATELENHQ